MRTSLDLEQDDPPTGAEVESVVKPDPGPEPIVYPLGICLWALGAFGLIVTTPPALRGQALGVVLFLLPLVMAILAAFLNLFARPERPAGVRRVARTLVFACLFPFVAWGEWESRRRRRS